VESNVETEYPINDLFIKTISLTQEDSFQTLCAYAFEDHLLKRIDSIEIIELKSGEAIPAFLRPQADELWVLLDGQVRFEWRDRREGSPTFNAAHFLTSSSPIRVLVPFGVQFNLTAERASRLLRICSHAGGIKAYLTEKVES
jgi:hypothetical protein